jgi:transposase-like protein
MSQRKFLTPEQKVSLIRAHLIDGVSVSDLCDKHGISPEWHLKRVSSVGLGSKQR